MAENYWSDIGNNDSYGFSFCAITTMEKKSHDQLPHLQKYILWRNKVRPWVAWSIQLQIYPKIVYSISKLNIDGVTY